jgi:hypothetical protein
MENARKAARGTIVMTSAGRALRRAEGRGAEGEETDMERRGVRLGA